ncbi:hypothetical protein B296_00009354 [Ensete ventricosum]|uniref:Uncharacterized protein n=1 Tax=Ensete ventricosum TaxID=4639 RepID=A0A427AY28_ENSVE|nr:hypothetical protein B296_00009354 [Ensete ventricosum]
MIESCTVLSTGEGHRSVETLVAVEDKDRLWKATVVCCLGYSLCHYLAQQQRLKVCYNGYILRLMGCLRVDLAGSKNLSKDRVWLQQKTPKGSVVQFYIDRLLSKVNLML